jgi:prepilin-type processing-associated H-X9-DG protein
MPADEIRPSQPDVSAFTRFDLVAVLAVLAILTALQLPSLAHTRRTSNTAICLNNHHQLTRAWRIYTEDNGDKLAGNLDGGDAQNASNSNRTWCVGWMDISVNSSHNTNVAFLLNAQLGRYTRTASVYKCPEDLSVNPRTTVPRVRSVSVNCYVGERAQPWTAGYRQHRQFTEVVTPTPAGLFVFIDEREDSINDGHFGVEMSGYDPRNPAAYILLDYPASYHGGGAGVGFADGHAEIKTWGDPRTNPALRPGQLLPLNVPSPNNLDVAWLQERASRRVQ